MRKFIDRLREWYGRSSRGDVIGRKHPDCGECHQQVETASTTTRDIYEIVRVDYCSAADMGEVTPYNSEGFRAAVSPPVQKILSAWTNNTVNEIAINLQKIDDTRAASAVAAALADDFLARHDLARARTLCDMAAGFNSTDLFPQRILNAVVEELNGNVGDLATFLSRSFCAFPFNHFETIESGDVYVCDPGWLSKPIGNLLHDDWQAIWQSQAARDIRRSIIDGSFKYCNPRYCNRISLRQLESRADLTPDLIEQYQRQDPTFAVFSHDRSCNLSCPACRKELHTVPKSRQSVFKDMTRNALTPIMDVCSEVKITGSGDPFGSIHFRDLISEYCSSHDGPRKITLHTNGVLLDERSWNDLHLENNVKDIIISIDAATEQTYGKIRRGGNFRRLTNNLDFVARLRAESRFDRLYLVFVVQKENYREIPDFVRLAKNANADKALFWQIKNWGTFSIEEFLDHAVSFPDHPEHAELLEVLRDPIVHDPVVSLIDLPVPPDR